MGDGRAEEVEVEEGEAGPVGVPAPGWGVVGVLGLDDLPVAGDEEEDEADKAKFGGLRPPGAEGSIVFRQVSSDNNNNSF